MRFAVSSVIVAALAVSRTAAFVNRPSRSAGHDVIVLGVEAKNSAFTTEYLVRAHEDKLRAVAEIEKKKNSEISALRNEVKELKEKVGALAAKGTPAMPDSTVSGNKDEIAAKLLSYQQFMAKYIVEAHQQKVEAVRAAELRITQKYEEQLRLLRSSNADADARTSTAVTDNSSVQANEPAQASASGDTKSPPVDEPSSDPSSATLYDLRNARIAAAAKAGKSRWGEMENERAVGAAAVSPAPQPTTTAAATGAHDKSTAPATPTIPITVPPEVEAADHGLRADGGVGGYTLAERVALGADVVNVGAAAISEAANGAATAEVKEQSKIINLYEQRNLRVVAAAKAGKARWGEMEVERATTLANSIPAAAGATAPTTKSPASDTAPPEVTAADHGLRADGGVGGPSLAQRVNLGAQLLSK